MNYSVSLTAFKFKMLDEEWHSDMKIEPGSSGTLVTRVKCRNMKLAVKHCV